METNEKEAFNGGSVSSSSLRGEVSPFGFRAFTKPEYANKLIQEGRVDLVAVGRELLEDPDWTIKAIKTLETS